MELEEQKQNLQPKDSPDDLAHSQSDDNSDRILIPAQQEFERPLLGRNLGSQQLIQSFGSSHEEWKAQMEEERKSEAVQARIRLESGISSNTSQTEKVSIYHSLQFEEVEPIPADPLGSSSNSDHAEKDHYDEESSDCAFSLHELSQPESNGSKSDCDEIPDEHPSGFTHHEYMRRYALRVVTITHSHDSHGLFDFEKRQGTRESMLTSRPGYFIRKDLNCRMVEQGTNIAE